LLSILEMAEAGSAFATLAEVGDRCPVQLGPRQEILLVAIHWDDAPDGIWTIIVAS